MLRGRSKNGPVKLKCWLFLFALFWFTVLWSLPRQMFNCYRIQTLTQINYFAMVSLKIMCLVLTVIFPRKIHLFKKKWLLAACTEWLLSAAPLVSDSPGLSIQWEQWSWLDWALPNSRTWNEMQPEPATSFFLPLCSPQLKITLFNATLWKSGRTPLKAYNT